jgi:hypothetical protein
VENRRPQSNFDSKINSKPKMDYVGVKNREILVVFQYPTQSFSARVHLQSQVNNFSPSDLLTHCSSDGHFSSLRIGSFKVSSSVEGDNGICKQRKRMKIDEEQLKSNL